MNFYVVPFKVIPLRYNPKYPRKLHGMSQPICRHPQQLFLIVIRQFSITIFFTALVFSLVGCWRAGPFRASVVIRLFSTFCEDLVLLVNTFLTYSTLTVCHFQHFKYFWILNSIFYTKFYAYSLIHFFDSRKSPSHAKHF